MINNNSSGLSRVSELKTDIALFAESGFSREQFQEKYDLKQSVQPSALFKRVESELAEIFSEHRLIGNEELSRNLLEMRVICKKAYEQTRGKSSGIFSHVFDKSEKQKTEAIYKSLDRMIENLISLNDYFLLPREKSEISLSEENVILSLLQLNDWDPKMIRKIIRKQSDPQDQRVYRVWQKTKNSMAHKNLDKILDGLDRLEKGKLDSDYLQKTQHLLEEALLFADLANSSGRESLQKHLETIAKKIKGNDLNFAGKKKKEEADLQKKHEKIATIVTHTVIMLENFPYLPTNLEELGQEHQIPRVRAFCLALRGLDDTDPELANKFLEKLAQKNDHPLLQVLSKSTTSLDFSDIPLHIRLYELFSSVRSTIKKVVANEIRGDTTTLDLTSCSPKIGVALLIKYASRVKKVILSPEIVLSKEFQELRPFKQLNDWGGQFDYFTGESLKPVERPGCILDQVSEVIIPQRQEKPVEMHLQDLDALVTVFPHAHYGELPPIEISDLKDKELREVEIGVFFDFINLSEKLAKMDERFHHAVLRSLIGSAILNDHQLAMLNDYQHGGLNTISPSHHMVLEANQKDSIQPKPHLLGEMKPNDWQQVSYLFLGIGRFQDMTLPHFKEWAEARSLYSPSLGEVNLSHNPLLTDHVLTEFLLHKDAFDVANGEKIERLNLSTCHNVTDQSIRSLLLSTKSLVTLDLSHNPQLTEQCFKNIPFEQFENLRFLDLRGTSVSLNTIELLREKHLKLRILWSEESHMALELYQERHQKGNLDIGEERVHKDLFLARAPQFESLIKTQQDQKRLTFPEAISQAAIRTLVFYIYTGSLQGVDDQTAFELLPFAMKNTLTGLVADCRQWFIRTMTPDNVLERYQRSKELGLKDLSDGVCRFIDLFLHPQYPSLVKESFQTEKEHIIQILKEHPSITLNWLDKTTFRIPVSVETLSEGETETSKKALLKINKEAIALSVPPELVEEIEDSIRKKFQGEKEETMTIDQHLLSSRLLEIKSERKPMDALAGMETNLIETDRTLILPSSGIRPSQGIAVNTTVLSSRSRYFKEVFKNGNESPLEIATKRPEAFSLILRALMQGKEIDLKSLSLNELVDVLKEGDRLKVTEQVVTLDNIVSWLNTSKHEAEDLAWIDLMKWAKKHHHAPLGLSVVHRFLTLFDEKGLKERWVSDSSAKKNIKAIVTHESFIYFQDLWRSQQGPVIMDYFYTSSHWRNLS
ncbi:MAG: hypothetical protein Tsb0021_10410 [Chlamydiales bacterium]